MKQYICRSWGLGCGHLWGSILPTTVGQDVGFPTDQICGAVWTVALAVWSTGLLVQHSQLLKLLGVANILI